MRDKLADVVSDTWLQLDVPLIATVLDPCIKLLAVPAQKRRDVVDRLTVLACIYGGTKSKSVCCKIAVKSKNFKAVCWYIAILGQAKICRTWFRTVGKRINVEEYCVQLIYCRSHQNWSWAVFCMCKRTVSRDVLVVWAGINKRFPVLAKIAQDVFSVCTSSTSSKTQFSKARKVANPFRNSLGHQSIQATLCLKSW